MTAQVVGPLSPMWENWMDFVALGFSLNHAWLLLVLVNEAMDGRFLSLCLSCRLLTYTQETLLSIW